MYNVLLCVKLRLRGVSLMIGSTIKQYRKVKKLSQVQLAKLCNVSENSIHNWEHNETFPRVESLKKLSEIFEIPMNALLKTEENANWTVDLEYKLNQIGHSLGGYEADAYLWINYPNGTLDVSEADLLELQNNTNNYMLSQLEQLKQRKIKYFKLNTDKR